MIKLIASDLDGTLLKNYEQEIPRDILETIKELKKRGILFAVASGRQYANIRRLFQPLGYEIPIIAENGSLCIYEEKMLSGGSIPAQTIRHILDGLYEYRRLHGTAHCILSVKDTYYSDTTDPDFLDLLTGEMHNSVTQVPDLYTLQIPFIKAAICDPNGTHILEPFFQEYVGKEIRVATSAAHWVDFIAPDANKGTALLALLEYLKIEPEECICFGDQKNDIEMLQTAGASYAMNTCAPGVEKYASKIINSVLPVLQSLLI